ncbi:hypothetical protein ASPBRDRAFT_27547 [Aspergillus brasiliensis CBS 101740]|uniref:Uncharacterized protein n=1 Tax=Aspergillus brasiliensis (strain CBS 101740 / IMI 381727 / IBT 21946) TaxID=767769 RepID=A0A1L9USF0_ASPBC|nr:hypothetical protein ASPBRDRAFT_27547 [Aspergillus brasiliensis CBS 101740]
MDTSLWPTIIEDLWPHQDMSNWPTLDEHLWPFYRTLPPSPPPPTIPPTHNDPILARRTRLKAEGITFEYYKKLFYTPVDNLMLIAVEFSLATLLTNMPHRDTLAHTPDIDRHHPHCIFAILQSTKEHLMHRLRTRNFANKVTNQPKYRVLCKFASGADTAKGVYEGLLERLNGVELEMEVGVRSAEFFPYRRGNVEDRLEIYFYEPLEPIVGWRSRGVWVGDEGTGRGH